MYIRFVGHSKLNYNFNLQVSFFPLDIRSSHPGILCWCVAGVDLKIIQRVLSYSELHIQINIEVKGGILLASLI
jgi:hypothetical protein